MFRYIIYIFFLNNKYIIVFIIDATITILLYVSY